MHSSAGLWHLLSLMYITVLKPVVYRGVEHVLKVPVRYRLQWPKTTIGWSQRAAWRKRFRVRLKGIALLKNCKITQKNIVLICKNSFFLRKLTHKFKFNSLFLRNLSEDWTNVVCLKKCPLYGFHFSSIFPWYYKCVKGKHKENRRNQEYLPFSIRSPR